MPLISYVWIAGEDDFEAGTDGFSCCFSDENLWISNGSYYAFERLRNEGVKEGRRTLSQFSDDQGSCKSTTFLSGL